VQPVVEQKTLIFKFYSVSKGSLIKELKINNLKANEIKSYFINDNANILCINTKTERWVYNVRNSSRIAQMHIGDEIFFIEQSNYFLKQVGFYNDIYLLNSYDATPLGVNFKDNKGIKKVLHDTQNNRIIIQGNSNSVVFFDIEKGKVIKRFRATDVFTDFNRNSFTCIGFNQNFFIHQYQLNSFKKYNRIKLSEELKNYLVSNALTVLTRFKPVVLDYALQGNGEFMNVLANVDEQLMVFVYDFTKEEFVFNDYLPKISGDLKMIWANDSVFNIVYPNQIIWYQFKDHQWQKSEGNFWFTNLGNSKEISIKKQQRIIQTSHSFQYSLLNHQSFWQKPIKVIKNNGATQQMIHFTNLQPLQFSANEKFILVSYKDTLGYIPLDKKMKDVFLFKQNMVQSDEGDFLPNTLSPIQKSKKNELKQIVGTKAIDELLDTAIIYPVYKNIEILPELIKINFQLVDSLGNYYAFAADSAFKKLWCKILLLDDDLNKQNIASLKIYENLSRDTFPINAALISDYSGSMGYYNIDMLEKGVEDFIVNKLYNDKISLIKYDSRVKVDAKGEESVKELIKKTGKTNYNELGGGTALYDAMIEAFETLGKIKSKDPKIAFVITDGFENSSMNTLNSVIIEAKKNNIVVFAIGLGDNLDKVGLKKITSHTGGTFYQVYDATSLSWIYNDIKRRANLHYTLEFDRPREAKKYTLLLKTCNPKCDSCASDFVKFTWNNAYKDLRLENIDVNDLKAFELATDENLSVDSPEEMEQLNQIPVDVAVDFVSEKVALTEIQPDTLNFEALEDIFDSFEFPIFEFVLDKDSLIKNYDKNVAEIVLFLNEHKAVNLKITGHTDDTGNFNHNMQLSFKRAVKVKQILMRLGIEEHRLFCDGKGPTKPLFPNSNDFNRAHNRRIEFSIFQSL
jgi:outer membrane protein OmpA-like peptidoglycan-associated protein